MQLVKPARMSDVKEAFLQFVEWHQVTNGEVFLSSPLTER